MKNQNTNQITKFLGAFGLFLVAGIATAFGEEAAAAASPGRFEILRMLAIGAPIGLGLAAAGCGLGQGRMAAQTMAGIARNPGAAAAMLLPMILVLAFIEGLTIFTLIFVFVFKAAFPF